MSDPNVKPEKTGKRDLALNNRHRTWGWNVPAEDIDFLEYDNKKAVALVEYKKENAPRVFLKTDANLSALRDLADRAGLPAFVVRYAIDFNWWTVRALNKIAKSIVPEPLIRIPESKYVEFLYSIRGRKYEKK